MDTVPKLSIRITLKTLLSTRRHILFTDKNFAEFVLNVSILMISHSINAEYVFINHKRPNQIIARTHKVYASSLPF